MSSASEQEFVQEEIVTCSGEDQLIRGGKRLALIADGEGLTTAEKLSAKGKKKEFLVAFGLVLAGATGLGVSHPLYSGIQGAIKIIKKFWKKKGAAVDDDKASEREEMADKTWHEACKEGSSRVVLDGKNIEMASATQIKLLAGDLKANQGNWSPDTWVTKPDTYGMLEKGFSALWVRADEAGMTAGKSLIGATENHGVLIEVGDATVEVDAAGKIAIETPQKVTINGDDGITATNNGGKLELAGKRLEWNGGLITPSFQAE